MPKINILGLTQTLNQMRHSESVLKVELYETINKQISYPGFIPQLKACGFIQVVGDYVAFQHKPIHHKKVEELVNYCRKKSRQYQSDYEHRKKIDSINNAIKTLKEEGYIIIKGGRLL